MLVSQGLCMQSWCSGQARCRQPGRGKRMLLLLPFAPWALRLLLHPCPHSDCLGHLEPPPDTSCLQCFLPSGLVTVSPHFLLAWPPRAAPWSAQLPRLHRLLWKHFQEFLNGVAVPWLVSHHLSKLSALLQEFKALWTDSLACLS